MHGGRVTDASYNNYGGNTVTIVDDQGRTYYYAHMQAGRPARGQTVAAGHSDLSAIAAPPRPASASVGRAPIQYRAMRAGGGLELGHRTQDNAVGISLDSQRGRHHGRRRRELPLRRAAYQRRDADNHQRPEDDEAEARAEQEDVDGLQPG
jgi:hypothetical protein